jgi:hypothetical protein
MEIYLMDLAEVESKIEAISLGYEVGEISREGDCWLYQRLENRSDDASATERRILSGALQENLVRECLLIDYDGQPDIYVHGTLTKDEFLWWIAPIAAKWGRVEAWVADEWLVLTGE